MNRWTGRMMWLPNRERPPFRWYAFHCTDETHYAPAGRYVRQRKWWWVLVVLFRIFRSDPR